MKRKFITVILFLIIFLSCSNDIISQRNVYNTIDSSYQFRLQFIGADRDINQMRNEFACAYPIYVNVPLDPSFRFSYPNPCSPSMLNETFIFNVPEITEVQIIFTDSNDSIYFNPNYEKLEIGYYYFQLNPRYLSKSEISKDALSEFKGYKIIFLIKDKSYAFPLSRISTKKL
ncbi:MAG: hypothetical protein N3D80_08945 [Ignavibacterium album]|jgi:hypothetical protein|uniref:hypothetical protein n=1 Tax=Ignavibacterium album TaxID=591197 RepID=UPI0026EFABA1|nr:hypothetical protein [Ignavibacterium album]MCX8105981.1 hypothetical protein [Ignavibacterium album]